MRRHKDMWSIPSSTSPAVNGSRPGNMMAGGVTNGNNSYAFLAAGGVASMMQLQSSSPSSNGMSGVGGVHERSQEVCKYFVNGGCLRGPTCPYLHELPDERHLDVNGLGFILNPNVHNAQKTVSLPQSSMTGSPSGHISPNAATSPLALGLNGPPVGAGPTAAAATASALAAGGAVTAGAAGLTNGGSSIPGAFAFGKGMSRSSSYYNTVSLALPPQLMIRKVKTPVAKYRPPEPFLEYNLPPALAVPLKVAPKDLAQSLATSMLQK